MSILYNPNTAIIKIFWSSPCDLELTGFYCIITLSQTSPGFYMSAVKVFWKHCGNRRNCSLWAISPFPTLFFTRLENILPHSSIEIVVCKVFEFWQVWKLLFGKGLRVPSFSNLERGFQTPHGNRRDAGNHHFLRFPQFFYTFPETFFKIWGTPPLCKFFWKDIKISLLWKHFYPLQIRDGI